MAPLRVGAKLRAGNDSRDFCGHVLTFSATVFAIMMPWRDQSGTDGGHSGRFDGAFGVDRGVGTGSEGAGGPSVAATNIAFVWPKPLPPLALSPELSLDFLAATPLSLVAVCYKILIFWSHLVRKVFEESQAVPKKGTGMFSEERHEGHEKKSKWNSFNPKNGRSKQTQ
jgi:hypothetical protein